MNSQKANLVAFYCPFYNILLLISQNFLTFYMKFALIECAALRSKSKSSDLILFEFETRALCLLLKHSLKIARKTTAAKKLNVSLKDIYNINKVHINKSCFAFRRFGVWVSKSA